MAGQESCLISSDTAQTLSNGSNLEESTEGQSEQTGNDLLQEAFVDANSFEGQQIGYSISNGEPQVCDTGQNVINSSISISEVHQDNSIIVPNPQSGTILHHTSSNLFPERNQTSLLTDQPSEVINVEAGESFTVGSLPEGHIISIPSDMITDSGIIPQNGNEHLQGSIGAAEESNVQLLQTEDHQHLSLTQSVESTGNSIQPPQTINILQSAPGAQTQLLQAESFTQGHHAITLSAPSGMAMTPEVLQTVLQQVQAQHLAQQQQQETQAVEGQLKIIKEEPIESSSGETTTVSQTGSIAEASSSETQPEVAVGVASGPAPPLGSSQNPIRIIQQGNRYTPMQQLSSEQLQQIMQVVQQQHVNKSAQDGGGSSAIIFNPQTNTRIMYRVIYPSELHKTQAGEQSVYQVVRATTASQEQQTGIPLQKRQYRRRKDITSTATSVSQGAGGEQDEKDKAGIDPLEMSKEEKEERKKHRPRTRSGRVSKPPKHMVQDYKHIHVLDWDEDYDDSDGGYSDFKHSDEEGKLKLEGEEEQSTSPDLFAALGAVRPKNHKCQACEKSYIGQAGLARHYRLNPDHCINASEDGSISSVHNGSIDGEDSKGTPIPQDGSLSRLSDSGLDGPTPIITSTTPGGQHSGSTNLGTFSEDSNTQDSLNSTGAPSPHTVIPTYRGTPGRGRGRGRFRGRWAHLKYNAQMRRKNKLKEFIKECSDEDLMEIVLPRLVTTISLWEFLMMKSEQGGTKTQVDVMYQEFESLAQHVREACSSCLLPLSEGDAQDVAPQRKIVKVQDKGLASCLNLEQGTYVVKDLQIEDCNTFSSLHNKISAAAFKSLSSMRPVSSLQQATNSMQEDSDKEYGDLKDRPGKRAIGEVDAEAFEEDEIQWSAPKRPRISTLPIPQRSSVSTGIFTVKAELPGQSDAGDGQLLNPLSDASAGVNKVATTLANSSTASLATSVQSSSIITTSVLSSVLAMSSSSSSASSSLSFSKQSTTLGSSMRSPFIHISCPTSKQKTGNVTHLLTSSPAKATKLPGSGASILINTSANSVQGNNRGKAAQVVAVTPSGQIVSSTSSNSNLLSPLLSTLGVRPASGQKFLLAGPGPQTMLALPPQHTTGPGSTALLLAAGAAAGTHHVVVRPPPAQPAGNMQKQLRQNHKPVFRSLLATATVTTATSVLTKPTEVKVSRQLFQDATRSTSSSLASSKTISLLTNVKSPSTSAAEPSGILTSQTSTVSAVETICSVANTTSVCSKATLSNGTISSSNKTLETPPCGQQFVASPNKVVSQSNGTSVPSLMGNLSDMDVIGIEFTPPAEELPSVLSSTPSDSLNGSFDPSSSNIVTTIIASNPEPNTATLPHKLNGNDRELLGPSAKIEDTSNGGQAQTPASMLSNGSNNSNGISLLGQGSVKSLPSTLPKPPSNYLGGLTSTTNGSLFPSQSGKTESNMILTNLSDLNFPNQVEELEPENGALSNGDIPSLVHTGDVTNQLNNDMDNDLSSNTQEHEQAGGNQQQLLLSEGTNIYQTEDGNFFIQSADGNTYQLQGAQGLPLETVQALLANTDIR